MGTSIRLLTLILGVALITGCTGPMVRLNDIQALYPVHSAVDEEQLRESILEGATYAGWVGKAQEDAKILSPYQDAKILASYKIRSHTVQVSISYAEGYYGINYLSSTRMKMYCTWKDKRMGAVSISGENDCTGAPVSINANYKIWIDELASAINHAILSK